MIYSMCSHKPNSIQNKNEVNVRFCNMIHVGLILCRILMRQTICHVLFINYNEKKKLLYSYRKMVFMKSIQ